MDQTCSFAERANQYEAARRLRSIWRKENSMRGGRLDGSTGTLDLSLSESTSRCMQPPPARCFFLPPHTNACPISMSPPRVGAVPTVDARHVRDLWPIEGPSPCYIQGWEEGMDLVKDHLADIYPHTRCRFNYGILENRIWNRERSVDRENASARVHYWMETAHLAEYVCTPPNISISGHPSSSSWAALRRHNLCSCHSRRRRTVASPLHSTLLVRSPKS
jgi:hypothetical protein